MLRRALPLMLFSIAVSVAVSLAVTMVRMGLIHVDPDWIFHMTHGEAVDSEAPSDGSAAQEA